jgi:hypothetical protein
MEFIELTGKMLRRVITDGEFSADDMRKIGVCDDSILRVNRQGDLELRRRDRWDIIGGLLGNYTERIHKETGLDWA